MRNKFFYIIALLSLALAACHSDSEDYIDASRRVAFRATEKKVTRATTEELSSNYHIYISALLHTDNPQDTRKTIQFQNTKIKKLKNPTDTDNTWSTDWEWPDGGHMDFIAWGGSATISDGNVAINYTDAIPSESENTTFDSVVLTLNDDMNGQNDILYLEKLDKTNCHRENGERGLVFKHAASCIDIAVKAADTITVQNFGLIYAKMDSIRKSGKLTATVVDPTSAVGVKCDIKPTWSEVQLSHNYSLAAFCCTDDTPLTISQTKLIEQTFINIPGAADAKLTIGYRINNADLAFSFPFKNLWENGDTLKWDSGNLYKYHFTVQLKKITLGAEEEQWQTEIGGSAFEPEWNVEISTGASEATWGVEIGGEAYEINWKMEMSVSALETIWVTEIGSTASEGDWNSETAASADEEEWSTETGGTASEENWTEETGGNAYEASWEPGEDIIIGFDPTPPASE